MIGTKWGSYQHTLAGIGSSKIWIDVSEGFMKILGIIDHYWHISKLNKFKLYLVKIVTSIPFDSQLVNRKL